MTRRRLIEALLLAVVVAVVQGRLLVRAVRPELAVRLAFLAGTEQAVDGDDRPGVLRSAADPWGSRRWGIHAQTGDDAFYSFGPDGEDDHLTGDDVIAVITPVWEGKPSDPFWSAMLWHWWRTLVLGVVAALLVTRELSSAIAVSTNRWREFAVAGFVASPASMLWSGWSYMVWEQRTRLALEKPLKGLEGWSLLPLPLTVTGTLFVGVTLVVLAVRLNHKGPPAPRDDVIVRSA